MSSRGGLSSAAAHCGAFRPLTLPRCRSTAERGVDGEDLLALDGRDRPRLRRVMPAHEAGDGDLDECRRARVRQVLRGRPDESAGRSCARAPRCTRPKPAPAEQRADPGAQLGDDRQAPPPGIGSLLQAEERERVQGAGRYRRQPRRGERIRRRCARARSRGPRPRARAARPVVPRSQGSMIRPARAPRARRRACSRCRSRRSAGPWPSGST